MSPGASLIHAGPTSLASGVGGQGRGDLDAFASLGNNPVALCDAVGLVVKARRLWAEAGNRPTRIESPLVHVFFMIVNAVSKTA